MLKLNKAKVRKANVIKLTEKNKLFGLEYIKDFNASAAAIRAGYSAKTAGVIGYELLAKPIVSEYINYLIKKRADKLEINAEWVLQRFVDISNRCMTAEPVMIKDDDGTLIESGEYQFDSAGANKATENIAKHIGFFEKDNEQANKIVLPPPSPDRIKEIKKKLEKDF